MGQLKGCTQRIDRRTAPGWWGAWLLLALAGMAGCASHPVETPDQRLQRQAAESARQVRHDLKDAGKEARLAMHQAGRDTRDIVAGARQGWREGAPGAGSASSTLDVNHATLAELERLPGVHAAAAHRIMAERPFHHADDLRKRGILTHAEYDRIADRIAAK